MPIIDNGLLTSAVGLLNLRQIATEAKISSVEFQRKMLGDVSDHCQRIF